MILNTRTTLGTVVRRQTGSNPWHRVYVRLDEVLPGDQRYADRFDENEEDVLQFDTSVAMFDPAVLDVGSRVMIQLGDGVTPAYAYQGMFNANEHGSTRQFSYMTTWEGEA